MTALLSYIFATDQGIAHGHNTLADALFLAAFIVAVIASVFAWRPVPSPQPNIASVLLCAAVALIALGWFVL